MYKDGQITCFSTLIALVLTPLSQSTNHQTSALLEVGFML